ncbi:MAG: hypothetical protein GXP17_00915 [Gammaproteobacteria bacterium]|nr:hypothetical protein [Gammaproteobacteria bacterium]
MSEKLEPLDVPGLTEIIRYFPLGEKVRYYPEYQKEGALDTIVLGYGVNDQFIYSAIDIRCQQESGRDVLCLTVDGEERLVNEIDSFYLLIPFNRDDDNKRDYMRRAELGPQGPFRRHNVITLMACSTGGILSHLDTVVRKILPLKRGIYAGHDVVLLDVMPRSLKLTDQRQHYRLQTALPAMLVIKDGDTHACTLMDFSEGSVQLQFSESNESLAALTEFRRLTLLFDASNGSQVKQYALDGIMYRKTKTSLVMKLRGIYKNDKVESLGLVDVLDIKASLLQHPATQQVLAEQRGG